ncbi:dephospho-CoA kinase [Alteromonas sp. KUL49]|uniref:dephospho-CoA kinase n=1 Tax=Alteromonas sp. KUL49 TaxID=2480798 RepID=UPI0010FFBBF2|nr:dephospho-CoA kinase [Alteromonas sp. KUL49]GEA10667.1 dephospho-CoA kinase [Alteromonas sp. KUL49]
MGQTVVVGLTGGIGSGKSAVSDAFANIGISIVDADIVARQVVEKDTKGLSAIVEHFGTELLLSDGTLNRPALREKVFNNSAEKEWLNHLLHPLIREEMSRQLDVCEGPFCILSVPLLVENKLTTMCDYVVVVDCPESLQLQRAMRRDGSSEDTIKGIMAAQATRTERKAAASHIIDNSTSLEDLGRAVDTLYNELIVDINKTG